MLFVKKFSRAIYIILFAKVTFVVKEKCSVKEIKLYLNAIHKYFPEFPVASIHKTGEGDNSIAFLVNEKYIFRFPKNKEAARQLQKETIILPIIQSQITFEIPQFEMIAPSFHFAAHKMIAGEPLTASIFYSLNTAQQKKIQQSLSEFLFQLHHAIIPAGKNYEIETMDLKEEYDDNFIEAKKYIYPHLSEKERNIISALFTEYLREPDHFNYTAVLIHNDFSKDHILINESTGEMSGIIDFGDMAFGDADYDLMYLWDEFGENFVSKLIASSSNVIEEKLRNKLIFFSLANKIQVLLECLKNNEDAEYEWEQLHSWFTKNNTTIL
jgi:aminoglycoside 2''-phosphotransferase